MAQISTMENAGSLMEYPDTIENADMEHYYEIKYSCPWRSISECKSCPLAPDCRQKIED